MQLLKKTTNDGPDGKNLMADLRLCEERRKFLLTSTRHLLHFIQEFAIDLKEINSEAFKKEIDSLSHHFAAEPNIAFVKEKYKRKKAEIQDYIRKQNRYLKAREKEFRDIITLLSNAVTSLDSENQDYNRKIITQSQQIEKIGFLDDLKQIKQTLTKEISELRETVREKSQRDKSRMNELAGKVSGLKDELEQVRSEAEKDGLTGVYNRKTFDLYIAELVARNEHQSTPFALLLIDVDNFKTINDTYGHTVGDRVLASLAGSCRSQIRGDDFVGRYGGEEFVLILPQASLRNAHKKARHLCKEFAATRYALDGGTGDQTLSLTVSIGVSAFKKGDTPVSVIERADKALYEAKHSGKNRAIAEK